MKVKELMRKLIEDDIIEREDEVKISKNPEGSPGIAIWNGDKMVIFIEVDVTYES